MNIQELLERQRLNSDSVICFNNQVITYDNIYQKSLDLSKLILNELSTSSQNIGIYIPNSSNYIISYFSILMAQKTIVPIYEKVSKEELRNTISSCELDFIFVSGQEKYFNLIDSLNEYNSKILIFDMETFQLNYFNENKDYIQKDIIANNINKEKNVAIMLNTSGSTSNPKKVMLTHENIISNIISHVSSSGLTSSDTTLIILPMCFGYCNTAQFLSHIYLGANIVIYEDIFLPRKFFTYIEKFRITNLTVVPTIIQLLINYEHHKSYNISSLKKMFFGGGVIDRETIMKFMEKYPSIEVIQTYGQTEAGPRITLLQGEFSTTKLGSVGEALPNVKIKLLNSNGFSCKKMELGIIYVKSNSTMLGYYKNIELTEEVYNNGWLNTGDIGYLDEDGFLYIKGREKNVIISGGINIYPEELEQIISSCKVVKEIYVYGVEDELLGEVPHADIVISKSDGIEELQEYIRMNVPYYKRLRKINYVDFINKTYNGKILRKK